VENYGSIGPSPSQDASSSSSADEPVEQRQQRRRALELLAERRRVDATRPALGAIAAVGSICSSVSCRTT
jgi:hypothetical protein